MNGIGNVLRMAREQLAFSQRELAERLGTDQSRVSRIESGSLEPTDDDLRRWLAILPSEMAKRIKLWLETPWSQFDEERPSWEHPDLETLATAATALQHLQITDLHDALRPSAQLFREELVVHARSLRSLCYRVAFVGSPGVGKSTAESAGLALRTPDSQWVLPTGGGRTTACEIIIEQGDQWGILVDPEPENEVRRLVEDLCASVQPDENHAPEERPSVPSEVRTALLNMAGLISRQEASADRRVARSADPLRELAAREGDRLVATILLKLDLPSRTLNELWWSASDGADPMTWLHGNLRRINRGLHPNVGLPRRIRVILARPIVEGPFDISVLDTRGVTDKVVRRPDLAECLADPRTITLLCSSFPSAPDLYVRTLMQYADEQELPNWQKRVAVILLARATDVTQVVYEDTGEPVESPEEGIEIKERQARQQMTDWGYGDVPLLSYNALNELPSRFQQAIKERVDTLREADRTHITIASRALTKLLANARDQAIQVARQAVSRDVQLALRQLDLVDFSSIRPQDLLLKQVDEAHPGSVRAMTRRQGLWRNLSLDLHLSDGAAKVARTCSREPILKLSGALSLIESRVEVSEAQGLIQQVRSAIDESRVQFVGEARSIALTTLWGPLHADVTLWADCENQWRRGKGFRSRVVEILNGWFESNSDRTDDFSDRLQAAWQQRFVQPIRAFCK